MVDGRAGGMWELLQKVGTERGWGEGLSGEPGKSGGPFGRGAVREERGHQNTPK